MAYDRNLTKYFFNSMMPVMPRRAAPLAPIEPSGTAVDATRPSTGVAVVTKERAAGALVAPSRRKILALLQAPGDSLVYLYDFGDGWEHDVVLEKIDPLPRGKRTIRARCLAGRRACPPEDCGGPPGYARMLQALEDPGDPEHARYREWVGSGFDPEGY